MACYQRSRSRNVREGSKTRIAIPLGDFEDRGRLHFFYHSPSSKLPVRDARNEQGQGHKTEPYLEKSAENYCVPCIQKNIIGFLRERAEKYLFLFTRCKSRNPEMAHYRNRRFIVGYIEKECALWRPGRPKEKGHWAVQGPIHIVSFEDSFPLKDLFPGRSGTLLRFRRLNENQARKVLTKLNSGKNILDKCIAELARLKRGRNTGDRI